MMLQVLEGFLRLTADRWSARAWNKFEEYNQFCLEQEKSNLGRELHGNRFGDLELCSAIGVYSLDTWVQFVETHPNIRNQLTIFLREVLHLAEICKFLWLGAALFGIHVTFPYMSLLLDLEATHTELLEILPKMYQELLTYPVSLAQLSKPGIQALAHAWVDPLNSNSSPYGKKISAGLAGALDEVDKRVMDKYIKELCLKEAEVLKNQRGKAYGFGFEMESAELVTKQLSVGLDKAPTHTKPVENLFGNVDMILSRFGPQALSKSSDDIVIKYSSDLLDNTFDWASRRMRKIASKVEKAQDEFTVDQKALIAKGVVPADAIKMTADNRIIRLVEACRKSHGGPISNLAELDNLLETTPKDKLRSALVSEIRYRKFSLLNLKDSNPVFKQRGIPEHQLAENLRLLLDKAANMLSCDVTMSDLEKVVGIIEEVVEENTTDDDEILTPAVASVQGPWPPKVGDHIAVNFEDGFYLGEVKRLDPKFPNKVMVSYMKPKKLVTAEPNVDKRQFWFWPSKEDLYETDRACVLPLRPVLQLAKPPSTRRFVVFKLENFDFIDKFAQI